MNKIWNQRLSQYQQKLLKYLRYVFNDHFVIALFFVFGAVCYGYFNFIDHYVHPLTLLDRFVAIIALMLFYRLESLQRFFKSRISFSYYQTITALMII